MIEKKKFSIIQPLRNPMNIHQATLQAYIVIDDNVIKALFKKVKRAR